MAIKNKKEAIAQLNKLDEEVVIRLAELSTNAKALTYFSNPVKFTLVKAHLN
ncbi:hypothetical protein [uncultured Tenacibaculum sp.]|uniref:hypothetical protein n=1 Tax=uncultured Tenacibaculum sp. TaxID=174713 RepID=UPI00261BA507|nr:hypothetical protein [uncultured Tenacibaculum sp.]